MNDSSLAVQQFKGNNKKHPICKEFSEKKYIAFDYEYIPREDFNEVMSLQIASREFTSNIDEIYETLEYHKHWFHPNYKPVVRIIEGITSILIPLEHSRIGEDHPEQVSILVTALTRDSGNSLLVLISHFNAAECQFWGRTLEDYAKLQADNENLNIAPIHKSAIITGITKGLKEGSQLMIHDISLITTQKSLAGQAIFAGIDKKEWDFDNCEISHELLNNQTFVEYALYDPIVALMAFEVFDETLNNNLIKPFKDKGLLSQDYQVLKGRVYSTAPQISADLLKCYLQNKGIWKPFQDFAEYMISHSPSHSLYETYGGFNVYFESDKPTIHKNMYLFDVVGMYGNAVGKIPIILDVSKARHDVSHQGTWIKVSQLARMINNKCLSGQFYGYFDLGNATESQRLFTVKHGDDPIRPRSHLEKDGHPATFQHWEIMALASVLPNAMVKIVECTWFPKDTKHTTLAEFTDEYQVLSREYKKTYGKKSPQRELVKLLGNSLCGKFAQHTQDYETRALLDVIGLGGEIPTLTKKDNFSQIYNNFIFNQITGLCRSLTYWASNKYSAVMCVTDSIAIKKQGADLFFRDLESNNWVTTEYDYLNKIGSQLNWDCERENVTLVIFKERDYHIYENTDDDVVNRCIDEINSIIGIDNLSVEQKIVRVGKKWDSLLDKGFLTPISIKKRGRKKPKNLTDSEYNNELARELPSRFFGLPVRQLSKKLTTFKDMFASGIPLMTEILPNLDSVGMGVHNIKYNLENIGEYKKRLKQKDYVRRKGFADMYHAENFGKDVYEKCLSLGHLRKSKVSGYISSEQKRALAILQVDYGISCRELEFLLDKYVCKTTLNKWSKEYKETPIQEWYRSHTDLESSIVEVFNMALGLNKIPSHIAEMLERKKKAS